MPRSTRSSSRRSASKKAEEDDAAAATTSKKDDRGISFGAAGGYDDAYNAGGDDDGEYVSELPTAEEERKLMGDVRAREAAEELDEGRAASSHPSTLAASKAKVSTVQVASRCFTHNSQSKNYIAHKCNFLSIFAGKRRQRRRRGPVQKCNRRIWFGQYENCGSGERIPETST